MRALAMVVVCALAACAAYGAEVKQIFPPGTKPAGPYSPGVLAGEYLYVAGQGSQLADGTLPSGEEQQIRQCLRNVETVVKAAGLTMRHVVYVQVYLTDYSSEAALNRVWREFFPAAPPARSTIGVAALHATNVEMSAVAVKDLALKKTVAVDGYDTPSVPISAAVRVGDRLFVSGHLGRDVRTGEIPADPGEQVTLAMKRLEGTLKAAGAGFENLVFVNPYLTSKIPMGVMNHIYASHFEFGNTPARATIEVAGLPGGANIEFTGVAVMDLGKRRAVRPKNMAPSPTASPCVFAGDTFYCSAKSGFIPGVNGGVYASTVETQMRQTMRNLLDGLEEAGMDFSNVVASNVYLDDARDFARMNGVYAEYFGAVPPARTTVQQIAPGVRAADPKGHWPELEQVSIVAVK